jgi:hypothetical protein
MKPFTPDFGLPSDELVEARTSVPASRDFVTSFLNFGLLSSVFCLPSS